MDEMKRVFNLQLFAEEDGAPEKQEETPEEEDKGVEPEAGNGQETQPE